jgi:hypothetical protein
VRHSFVYSCIVVTLVERSSFNQKHTRVASRPIYNAIDRRDKYTQAKEKAHFAGRPLMASAPQHAQCPEGCSYPTYPYSGIPGTGCICDTMATGCMGARNWQRSSNSSRIPVQKSSKPITVYTKKRPSWWTAVGAEELGIEIIHVYRIELRQKFSDSQIFDPI